MSLPARIVGDPGCQLNWEANLMTATAVAALPAAGPLYRGKLLRIEGGVGVADQLRICVKDAADVYSWKTVTVV